MKKTEHLVVASSAKELRVCAKHHPDFADYVLDVGKTAEEMTRDELVQFFRKHDIVSVTVEVSRAHTTQSKVIYWATMIVAMFIGTMLTRIFMAM